MRGNLSTAEVARILGMRPGRVRELVRWGACRPPRSGRGYSFSFQDVVVLRAARGLLEAGVAATRVRRALAALARELPPSRPLSGLRIYADGREVAVCDGDAAWHPASGQTVLNFEVDALARLVEDVHAAPAAPDAAGPSGPRSARAQAEFERALALEDRDPKAARAAYERALALDAELVDAYVNLGRLAHEAGDAPEAVRLYHLALERTPDDPLVHFNLGVALEDLRGPGPAASHYTRALALDPEFADAHWNLAGLYEQLGQRADALRHYSAYKKLTD